MNESDVLSLAEREIRDLGKGLGFDHERPFVAALGVLMADNAREFARIVVARFRCRLGAVWGELVDDGDASQGHPAGAPVSFKAHFETLAVEQLASDPSYRVAMGGFIKGAASYVMPLAERSINQLGLELCLSTKPPFVAAVGAIVADNARELARAVVETLRRSLGDSWGDLVADGDTSQSPPTNAPSEPQHARLTAYLVTLGVELLASNHPYRVAMGGFIKNAANVFAQGIAEQLRAELGDDWEQRVEERVNG